MIIIMALLLFSEIDLLTSHEPMPSHWHFLYWFVFLGYAPELIELLAYKKIQNKEDDQLFYTNAYLDTKLRESLKMTLDHNSAIFQNLHGALCKYLFILLQNNKLIKMDVSL